jgi:hypothetical protein
MRGNRFAGFGGASIAPGLVLPLGRSFWTIASQAALADTDPVTSWPDTYHGLYDLVPGSATAPLYVADTGNGLPGVQFDGASMRLESPSVSPRFDLSPPLSFFFLFSVPALPVSTGNLFQLTDTNTIISLDSAGLITAGADMLMTTSAPIIPGNWYAVSIIFNHDASRLRLFTGGAVVEDLTGDMGATGASGVLYVGGDSGGSSFFQGYFAEIILVGTAVSDLDMNGFEQSVRAYTG